MSLELHVAGTSLEWDSAGGTSYSSLSRVIGIGCPPKERGVAETTAFDAANKYRTFTQGWKTGGEVPVKMLFHKTQYALLDAAYETETAIPAWRFTFPLLASETTGSRWTYSGIITKLGMPEKSVDGENLWEVEMTLKITGKPTFTSGS
jgi:hypothetical protein